jgi:Putative zinc-finger
MTCAQARSMFSAYLDGAITGKQMFALGQHLRKCDPCTGEYSGLRETQRLLGKIGRAKAPEDLSLRLRLAISHEAARTRQASFASMRIHFENMLRAFMVPATTGLVVTVLVFGLLAGFITLPLPVQADTADVPLMLYTGPELQQSGFGFSMDAISEDSLVIEAYVDANGRIQDYRILSNPGEVKELPHQVKNMLIFTTFRPATWMGTPRPGTAVLSFSKISVKG